LGISKAGERNEKRNTSQLQDPPRSEQAFPPGYNLMNLVGHSLFTTAIDEFGRNNTVEEVVYVDLFLVEGNSRKDLFPHRVAWPRLGRLAITRCTTGQGEMDLSFGKKYCWICKTYVYRLSRHNTTQLHARNLQQHISDM